jgi:hypothetical protein
MIQQKMGRLSTNKELPVEQERENDQAVILALSPSFSVLLDQFKRTYLWKISMRKLWSNIIFSWKCSYLTERRETCPEKYEE